VGRAAELAATDEQRRQLRDLLVEALALPDLTVGDPREIYPSGSNGLAHDARGGRYAVSRTDGSIRVRRAADGVELLGLPGQAAAEARLEFDPTGRYLAAGYPGKDGGGTLHLWDLERRAGVFATPLRTQHLAWAFAPDGSGIAVALEKDLPGVVLFDLPDGRVTKRIDLVGTQQIRLLAFAPGGGKFAVVNRRIPFVQPKADNRFWRISFVSLLDGTVTDPFVSEDEILALAWHPEANCLAWAAPDGGVHVATAGGTLVSRLRGHASAADRLTFTPDGRFLISAAAHDELLVWDPSRGQPVVRLPLAGEFLPAPNGDLLGITREGKDVRACRLSGPEVRTLVRPGWLATLAEADRRDPVRDLAFSADGRLLAAGEENGVSLWDVKAARWSAGLLLSANDQAPRELKPSRLDPPALAGRFTRMIPVGGPLKKGWRGGPVSVAFAPDDSRLYYGNATFGLFVRPVRPTPESIRLGTKGRPSLGDTEYGRFPQVVLSPDGRRLTGVDVARGGDRVSVHDLGRAGARRELLGRGPLGSAALSADARLAAAGSTNGVGTRVWDVATGKVLADLDDGDASVAFSPDGRWLATGSRTEYRLYDTANWRVQRTFPRDNTTGPGPLAFSPDGAVLALAPAPAAVRLIDVAGLRELASLPVARPDVVSALRISRDGTWLALGTERGLTHLWDLRGTRGLLRAHGLDWALPAPPDSAEVPPLKVEVE
jgi:WD40 repeat protein